MLVSNQALGTLSVLLLLKLTESRVSIASFGPDNPNTYATTVSPAPLQFTPFSVFLALESPEEVAKDYLNQNFPGIEFILKDNYKSHSGVSHYYYRQVIHGLELVNGDVNINIDSNGRVIGSGHSLWHGSQDGWELIEYDPSMDDPVHSEDTSENAEKSSKQSLNTSENVESENGDEPLAENFTWKWFESGLKHLRQHVFSKKTYSINLNKRDNSSKQAPNNKKSNQLTPKQAFQSFAAFIRQPVPAHTDLVLEATSSLLGTPKLLLSGASFTRSPVPVQPVYLNTGSGLVLVWDLQAELDEDWLHSLIGVSDGKVYQMVNWVSEAHSYKVYPLGTNDPLEGDRVVVTDPENKIASPFGWHANSHSQWNDTRGNNVIASENKGGVIGDWENKYRPLGVEAEDGETLKFEFELDLKDDPSNYTDAAITNLFYLCNEIHDLTYQYGFNEVAGNFQDDNFGRGGKGGDGVIATAQDGAGFNNANFATPPDGGRGKMRMYIWNVSGKPYRDGDLESGIVIHEYTHGISIRLTGGPANSGCLGWGESGGMGEGWGDFVATILRMKPHFNRTQDFAMGEYANGGKGIRKFPYSTNIKTNPETYGVMDSTGYWGVHAKGEVWAEMLYEVYWNLVDKHGFTEDWFSASKEHGNTLALQLVIDAMKLQPCRPSFNDARDAMILADSILTKGDNACEIWSAFAKRGLGVGSRLVGGTPWGGGKRKESFSVPKKCKKQEK